MELEDWFHIDAKYAGLVLGAVLMINFVLEFRARRWNPSNLPVLNNRKWFELGYGKATQRYNSDPLGMLKSGFQNVRTSSP